VNLKVLLLFVDNVVFNAIGNIMMKRGMNSVNDIPLNIIKSYCIQSDSEFFINFQCVFLCIIAGVLYSFCKKLILISHI